MITNFWRTTGGLSPWGPFDPDDSVNFSFDAAEFLAAAGTGLTLGSMELVLDPKLKSPSSATSGTVKTWRVERDPLVTAAAGDTMKMTVRTTASDGQHVDKTFYLILQNR